MAQVTITVNSRHYTIGCADGEEPRLRELAADLDRRMGDLVSDVGQIGDARLLVMLCLLLLDEMEGFGSEALAPQPGSEDAAAALVEGLAERIERLAEQLEAP